VLVASILLVTFLPAPASATTRLERYRHRLLSMMNNFRVDHGVPRLHERSSLSDDAQRHTVQMASQNRLFHSPDLWGQVRTYDPHAWGENIGYAGSISRVVQMWKRSAGHRHNMLSRSFDRAGLGVVRRGGVYWITVMYYG
jgi:uncharacterized protein YkwD